MYHYPPSTCVARRSGISNRYELRWTTRSTVLMTTRRACMQNEEPPSPDSTSPTTPFDIAYDRAKELLETAYELRSVAWRSSDAELQNAETAARLTSKLDELLPKRYSIDSITKYLRN